MPRYFFDLFDGLNARDEEGMDLPDVQAVQSEALRSLRELMGEDIATGTLNLGNHIQVRDESSKVICTLRYADAVEIIPVR